MDEKTRNAAARALGAILAIGAGMELVLLGRYIRELSVVWSQAVATGQAFAASTNALFLAVFVLLMLVAMLGGIQFLRLRRNGLWFALVGLIPQVVSIVVSGFQYRCAMFAMVALGAAGTDEKVKIGLFTELGSQMLLGFDPSSQWMVQLNIGAIGAISLLVVVRPRADSGGRR
jgi:hypothetical protein